MIKNFLYLFTFLFLVGCSTPNDESQNLESENANNSSTEEAASAEDGETAEKIDKSTEESSEIAAEDNSADDEENETETTESISDDENNDNNSMKDKNPKTTLEDGEIDKDNESSEEAENSSVSEVGSSKFIDVLSQDFINVYFSGPDTYIPSELTLGMSQTEVEGIYGKHDSEYQLEGANLAIYGNVGILYSQYSASGDVNPDENFINDIWIYINQPHSTVLNTYGSPTVDYNEYELYGPGDKEMIYDGTRGNGYAVYVAVQNDNAMVMRKSEERDLNSFPYTTENK